MASSEALLARRGRRLLAAALVAACALPAAAADEPLVNPVLGDPAAIAAGRKTYRQRCYICHLGQGGRGPNLFAGELSDEAFLMVVINGRNGATMPAFGLKLSPDQVWEVHAYVRSTDRHE